MSTLKVQKQFSENKRKLGILNLKKTLNKVILMGGVILAITVLVTSAIVSAAEAKPFSDRKDSGIVANCRVDHVGRIAINCAFSDKDGVGLITWTDTNGGEPDETSGECENRYKEGLIVGDPGDLQITITDCAVDPNTITFCYHKDGKKLTQQVCS